MTVQYSRGASISLFALLLCACGATHEKESTGEASNSVTTPNPGPGTSAGDQSGSSAANCNPDVFTHGFKSYDLVTGTNQYAGAGGPVILVNNSDAYLQLDKARVLPNFPVTGKWGEFGVSLNEFNQYPDPDDNNKMHPGQPTPGVGEVGDRHKENADAAYPVLKWRGAGGTTGLSVPPGSCLVVGGYTNDTNGPNWDNNVEVSVSPQTAGLLSFRQPTLDHIFTGTGSAQQTSWRPIQNTTDHNEYLRGATIFSVGPGSAADTVTAACIYVLDVNNQIRQQFCNPQYPVNANGVFYIPTETIAPGESVVAQATNTAPAGDLWGWAAYLYMSN